MSDTITILIDRHSVNADIQDLFATARRLDALRDGHPWGFVRIPYKTHPSRGQLPLAHRADRQRDGPGNRYPVPFRGIERATGQIRPSQRIGNPTPPKGITDERI